jgi:hypothetical protein
MRGLVLTTLSAGPFDSVVQFLKNKCPDIHHRSPRIITNYSSNILVSFGGMSGV